MLTQENERQDTEPISQEEEELFSDYDVLVVRLNFWLPWFVVWTIACLLLLAVIAGSMLIAVIGVSLTWPL